MPFAFGAAHACSSWVWRRHRRQASTIAIIYIYILVDLRVVNSRWIKYLWSHTWDMWCTDIQTVMRTLPNSLSLSLWSTLHMLNTLACMHCVLYKRLDATAIPERADRAICVLLAQTVENQFSVEIILVCIFELWIRFVDAVNSTMAMVNGTNWCWWERTHSQT